MRLCVFCLQIFATIIASVETCFIHITQFANRFEQSMWQKRAARRMCAYPEHRRANTYYSCTSVVPFYIWKISANLLGSSTLEHRIIYVSDERVAHMNHQIIRIENVLHNGKNRKFCDGSTNGITMTVWISYINRSCHLFSVSSFPMCVLSLMLSFLHSQSKWLCFIMSNGIHLIPAFNRYVDVCVCMIACTHSVSSTSSSFRAPKFLRHHHHCQHYHRFFIGFCKDSQEQ